MYLGKIMEIGPADRVIHQPHNPYTKALVSVVADARAARRGTRAKRTILVGRRPTPPTSRPATGSPALPAGVRPVQGRRAAVFDVGNGQSAACWLVEGGRSLPVMPRGDGGAGPGVAARPQPRWPPITPARGAVWTDATPPPPLRPGQDRRPARRRGGHRGRGVPRPRRRRLPVGGRGAEASGVPTRSLVTSWRPNGAGSPAECGRFLAEDDPSFQGWDQPAVAATAATVPNRPQPVRRVLPLG